MMSPHHRNLHSRARAPEILAKSWRNLGAHKSASSLERRKELSKLRLPTTMPGRVKLTTNASAEPISINPKQLKRPAAAAPSAEEAIFKKPRSNDTNGAPTNRPAASKPREKSSIAPSFPPPFYELCANEAIRIPLSISKLHKVLHPPLPPHRA